MRRAPALLAILGCLLLLGCGEERAASAPHREPCPGKPPPRHDPSPVERERDEIFMLLAYSVALRSTEIEARAAGHDIAAVLVDPEQRPVCWGRNAMWATGNATEHAELRLLRNYLDRVPESHLRPGFTVYTTLEPCAMCAGAMLMTGVTRVVHGESTQASGGVFARLALDGRAAGGLCPYPYSIQAGAAPVDLRGELEQLSARPGDDIQHARERRAIYERARARLHALTPRHAENETALRLAREFDRAVPADYEGRHYDVACPPRAMD